MRSFAFALMATLMALVSIAAAARECPGQCHARAGSTKSSGPTGFLHVWDLNGKKVGLDSSLFCFGGSIKQLKEGSKVAEKNSVTVEAGKLPDMSVKVTCDGELIDTCVFEHGGVKSDTINASRKYAGTKCDYCFDC